MSRRPPLGDAPAPANPSGPKEVERWILEALAYVPAVARRFAHCGVPLDELLAAGNLGLVQAALRYDPARNTRFTTYADWWIRKTILQTIQEQSGPVRLPRHRFEKLRRVREARARLEQAAGEPSEPERVARAAKLSLREVEALLSLEARTVSLDQPAGSDHEPLRNRLASDPALGPQQRALRRDLVRYVRVLMGGLDARARQVLVLRYGLDGGPARPLRDVGRRLGLSRERVRQIERRALSELRDRLLAR